MHKITKGNECKTFYQISTSLKRENPPPQFFIRCTDVASPVSDSSSDTPMPHSASTCVLPAREPSGSSLLALGEPSQAWQLTAPPDVVFPPLLQLAPGLAGAVQSVGRPSAADLAATSAQPVGTTGGVPESLVPTTWDTSAAAVRTNQAKDAAPAARSTAALPEPAVVAS